jgi:hypothetical protein
VQDHLSLDPVSNKGRISQLTKPAFNVWRSVWVPAQPIAYLGGQWQNQDDASNFFLPHLKHVDAVQMFSGFEMWLHTNGKGGGARQKSTNFPAFQT